MRSLFWIQSSKLAPTYSPPNGVPSAMRSLTSVFGMRTGVPSSLKHQLRTFNRFIQIIACNAVEPFHLNETAGGDGWNRTIDLHE